MSNSHLSIWPRHHWEDIECHDVFLTYSNDAIVIEISTWDHILEILLPHEYASWVNFSSLPSSQARAILSFSTIFINANAVIFAISTSSPESRVWEICRSLGRVPLLKTVVDLCSWRQFLRQSSKLKIRERLFSKIWTSWCSIQSMPKISPNFSKEVIIHQSSSLCSLKKKLIWAMWVMFEASLSSARRNLTNFVRVTIEILCSLTKLIFTKPKVDASMSISIVVFCNSCCVCILASKINWRPLMNMSMTSKWQDDSLTMARCESTACSNWWILLRISLRSSWVRLSSKTSSFSNDIELPLRRSSSFHRLHPKQCRSLLASISPRLCPLSIDACKAHRLL